MGQMLSFPETEKHSKSGQDDRFLYSVTEMQGWRITMEDAHAIDLNLDDKSGGHNAFFAIYDGHAGGEAARLSGENVHKRLVNEPSYAEHQWDKALKRAFLGTDDDIRAVTEQRVFSDRSGCTAVAALFTQDGHVFVANAGDSRAVISVKGAVKGLSVDHKPLLESEVKRINSAGGWVECGRVNGNLALSRALGDFEFKKNVSLPPEEQVITANPDVVEHTITEEDEFLVLACDGIWDCLTSQQVVDIIRLRVSQRKELPEIGEFLCDLCLAPDTRSDVGCDNMTVLVVAILNGRTKEQWYDWMEDRVKRNYGYSTPTKIPQLYSQGRIDAFRARRMVHEEGAAYDGLNKNDPYSDGSDNSEEGEGLGNAEGGYASVFGGRALGSAGGLSGFARSMLGTGISFHPSTGISSDDGTLMFPNDDSDDDSDDDLDPSSGADGTELFDENSAEHQFLTALGLRPPVSDVTKTLRAQLDELEASDNGSGSRIEEVDDDEDDDEEDDEEDEQNQNQTSEVDDDDDHVMSNPGDEAQQAFGAHTQTQTKLPNGVSTKVPDGEAPPPPPLVNGGIKVTQLSSLPGGDEAPPVVKAEGFLDGSESPLKG